MVAAGPSWVEVELGPAAPLFTGGIVVPGEENKCPNESALQAWWACFRHKEMVDIEVPEKLHLEGTKEGKRQAGLLGMEMKKRIIKG